LEVVAFEAGAYVVGVVKAGGGGDTVVVVVGVGGGAGVGACGKGRSGAPESMPDFFRMASTAASSAVSGGNSSNFSKDIRNAIPAAISPAVAACFQSADSTLVADAPRTPPAAWAKVRTHRTEVCCQNLAEVRIESPT
jgi:hypothetical protein